jgi:predicted nuclease of predicted toxin-antitoxin system
MTIWLDAHLDPELAPWLGIRFDVTAKPLREIGLRDADDIELFEGGKTIWKDRDHDKGF